MRSPAPTASEAGRIRKVFATRLDASLPIQHIETTNEVDLISCEVNYGSVPLRKPIEGPAARMSGIAMRRRSG